MRYRNQRLPSDNDVRLEHDGSVERVQLVDISSSGAKALHLEALPRDALVTVCHLNLRIPARVVWSDDEQTAMRFVRPLSTTDRDVLRGARGGRMAGWGSSAQHGFRELS